MPAMRFTFCRRLLSVLLLLTFCATVPARSQTAPPPSPSPGSASKDHPPVDAVQGIVAAFQKHPVVAIGEWRHGLRQLGNFYARLVQDQAFQQSTQDIVIAFASRSNQALLDRYISGEDVPIETVRHLWEDTTHAAWWESPVYAETLAAIRDVNKKLSPDRRFRVWAADPAIDWSRVQTHAEWEALGAAGESYAAVIMSQVLARHRHALVLLGGPDLAKLGHEGHANAATIVEGHYPGALYVVIHRLLPNAPDEGQLELPGHPDAPALLDLTGTVVGSTPDHNGVAPERYVDAWLSLGPPASMATVYPPPGSLDADYLKEIDRRSIVEWGDTRARRFLAPSSTPSRETH